MPTGLSPGSTSRLRTLLRLVTPGRVLGIFDPERRWCGRRPADPSLEYRPAHELRRGTRPEPGKHLWVESYGTGVPLALLACRLRGGSLRASGVALVTDRVALLLRAADLVVTFRRGGSGANRSHRVSAPRRSPYPELRLFAPAEVARSAVVSIWVSEWNRAWRVLAPWYPGVGGEGTVLRVPLAGATPEEVLHHLHHEGIRVHRSVVWYPPLQGRVTPGDRWSSSGG